MPLEQASLLVGCVFAAIAMVAWYPPRKPRLGVFGTLCAVGTPIAFAIAFAW